MDWQLMNGLYKSIIPFGLTLHVLRSEPYEGYLNSLKSNHNSQDKKKTEVE